MDIKKELIEYIGSDGDTGALLLTGRWGCGKSYFVKEIAKELNEQNKYAIAFISLFGINCLEELHERVRNEYFELSSGFLGDKEKKFYNFLQRVANEGAKVTSAVLSESSIASAVFTGISSVLSLDPLRLISVKKTLGTGTGKLNFIIIFDDFERCGIPIQDLMGVINEYSENREIRTVLIADEERIDDDKYKEFKEKLIARTLKFNLNHYTIIDSVIRKNSDSDGEYKDFLIKHKDSLQNAFFHSGYNNLRTLKACIIDFRRVYYAWKNSNVSMHDIDNVLYKFCAREYEAKAGLFVRVNKFQNTFEYNLKYLNTDEDAAWDRIANKYLPGTFSYAIVNSLARWIVDGDWDEESFVKDIKRRYAKVDISIVERFVAYELLDLEQKDVTQGMISLIDQAYQGDATSDELISLFQKIYELKRYGITLPCEVDYAKINEGFEKRKARIRKGEVIATKCRKRIESMEKEARVLYDKVVNINQKIEAWKNRRLFIDFLQKKDYDYGFKDKCIDCFDDELREMFIWAYKEASNQNKRDILRTLKVISFNNNQYCDKEDKEISKKNFALLIEQVERLIVSGDQISMILSRSLKEELVKKLIELDVSIEK